MRSGPERKGKAMDQKVSGLRTALGKAPRTRRRSASASRRSSIRPRRVRPRRVRTRIRRDAGSDATSFKLSQSTAEPRGAGPTPRLVTPANLVKVANLGAGFCALLQVLAGNLIFAIVLVALACLFDALDGTVARHSAGRGRFNDGGVGASLDSLADVVSFGAVPALIAYTGLLGSIPVLGAGACVAFVSCGALRLARFSVERHEHCFAGLPIPPSGMAVAMLPILGGSGYVGAVGGAAVVTGLGALMVSRIPIPTLERLCSRSRALVSRRPVIVENEESEAESEDTRVG